MKHIKKNIALNKEKESYEIKKWKKTCRWLLSIAKSEGHKIEFLCYTLVKDKTLLKMNIDTLGHNTYTDIITFDLSDKKNIIEGDIYISYNRVKENAKEFHVKHVDEMRRVLAHGLLHLLGYKDKTNAQKKAIREREDYYLNVFNTEFDK